MQAAFDELVDGAAARCNFAGALAGGRAATTLGQPLGVYGPCCLLVLDASQHDLTLLAPEPEPAATEVRLPAALAQELRARVHNGFLQRAFG
ncbi:hypothetical protein [Streptomyces sp. CdTB01]|uniref:hypothetical protein n=1 Tax=Streptomyces sp. CdTB01 TaxID=1725411 RepID=UPI00073ACECB|nr:hypothetical protein [Streptomyces sp. CdTB01]ALV30718.1 hypothetical protein AS200_00350 [Streptomyces sp. CdTB01]